MSVLQAQIHAMVVVNAHYAVLTKVACHPSMPQLRGMKPIHSRGFLSTAM